MITILQKCIVFVWLLEILVRLLGQMEHKRRLQETAPEEFVVKYYTSVLELKRKNR